MDSDKSLNVEQVKKSLNCSRSHVYNLINIGELAAFRIGSRNGVRVKESEVDRFIKERKTKEDFCI